MIKFLIEDIKVDFMAFELSERAEYRQFEMVAGDTAPAVKAQMYSTMEETLSLIGYEVHFFLRRSDDMDTIINDGHTQCIVTNALEGQAEYHWVLGDTASKGIHFGEFVLISATGRQTIKDRIRFNFI